MAARSPRAFAAASMLVKASGEFSGTSIIVMPAATSASQAGTVSSGVMPRRMAIR
jgi:hypothetical protein